MRRTVIAVALAVGLLLPVGTCLAYNFFDGNDWNRLDTYGLAPAEETQVKTMFLKTIYEVSLFNGAPLLKIDMAGAKLPQTYNADFTGYVGTLNTFYADLKNLGFPLFFALRVADLVKKGAPDAEVENYKTAIMMKLREQGLWK
ncbi:MAG: hypothetical protein WCG78_08740 [Candidatus Omnitrophota bacterium]